MFNNKLKKPPTMSATMALASSTLPNGTLTHANSNYEARTAQSPASMANSMQMQPLTAKEQYWATRALRAEALLTAQEHHKKEVKNLEHAQEMKLQRELAMISKEYKEKQTMLEKLLAVLAAVVAILILVIIYLTIHYARHSTRIQHKQQERWWAAIGASHFTIPILSPFTSVVEHETSAIGSKVIATIATITACLVYFIFRHWLSSKQTNKPVSSAPRMISAATQMLPSIDR